MAVHVQRWLTVTLALVLTAAGSAAAQTGAIAGRVTDARTSAPVPAALVEARLASGGVEAAATTRSDSSGSYRLTGLASGSYFVTVRTIGFAPQTMSDVGVAAGQTATVDVTLSRGAQQLGDVVVTSASRRAEKALEAPAHVEVVPTQDIHERPALSTTDQIRQVPGVDVAQTGLTTGPVVARGFNNVFSGALLTITDNRYASVPSLRVNTPALYPTTNEDIDRIEVVLGPGSALYGPNSAGGVLHIITQSPFDVQGTTVSVGGGSRSVVRGAVRHAGVVSERFGYKLAGQYMSGKDWEFNDPVEQTARQAPGANPRIGARDFDMMRWTAEGRLDFKPTPTSGVIFAAGTATAGTGIEMTGIGSAQVKDWRYDYYQLRTHWNRLFAQVFLNQSNAGDTYLLRTGQFIVDKSRLLVGQIQHGIDLGRTQTFTYGIDVQRTDPRTEGTINGRNEDQDEINEVGGYLQSETRLSRFLTFVAAGRVDKHSELEDPVFSPRAALVIKPARDHNVRLTYNRAFSTPTTNNLFLDITVQRLNAQLPYFVRTVGVPEGGLRFRRDCAGGLCMLSPFAANQTAFRGTDITGLWEPIVRVLGSRGIDITTITPPTPAQVQTVLRQLNTTTGLFNVVQAGSVRDVEQLSPEITNTFELGYQGLIGRRLLIAADVYRLMKKDFVGPLNVESPNVFVDPTTFAIYMTQQLIARGVPPAQAQAQATAMAQAIGPVPLGTVTPNSALTSTPDLFLTYRNFGDLKLWGADFAAEANLTEQVSLNASYSWNSKNYFTQQELGGLSPIALNAPRNKGSLGVRFRDEPSGISLQLRGRTVGSFPMNSGVFIGDIESYTVADANIAYRLPTLRQAMISLSASNIGKKHREFIGAPEIGTLVLGQVQYSF